MYFKTIGNLCLQICSLLYFSDSLCPEEIWEASCGGDNNPAQMKLVHNCEETKSTKLTERKIPWRHTVTSADEGGIKNNTCLKHILYQLKYYINWICHILC